MLNNDGNQYKTCQVLREDHEFGKYVDEDGG